MNLSFSWIPVGCPTLKSEFLQPDSSQFHSALPQNESLETKFENEKLYHYDVTITFILQ